jgi:ribonuclease BN (tRNA processing enzyme)
MNQNKPDGPGRRGILRAAAALSGMAATVPVLGSGTSSAEQTSTAPPAGLHRGTELVLLGTSAGPVPMAGRTGIASALVVDGRIYIVDLGHGAFEQFDRAGLSADQLAAIFVTHLHSDHIADLYTLLFLRFGGIKPLTRPVDVHGPGRAGALPAPYPPGREVVTVNPDNPTPGLTDLINGQIAATAYDINLRIRDEGWPDIRRLVRPHDIKVPEVGASPTGHVAPLMEPFTVMSDDRVKVSAILVEHPSVFPSFAFRFDTPHGSVVFSGDTTVTPNLVTLARHADVLVHEAIDMQVLRAAGLSPEQVHHHEISHTDSTKLGPVAQRADVGTLVLSHLAPGDGRLVPDAVWKLKAGRGYDGRVIVGRDLMRIRV